MSQRRPWRRPRALHPPKPATHNRWIVKPDGCTKGCPLQGWTRVKPEGNEQATIALVGEGPGKEELEHGRPFIGRSGQLLDWMLQRAGLSRGGLWITNAACCLPRRLEYDALDDDGRAAGTAYISENQTKKESTQIYCRPRLLAELRAIKPRVIVAAGALALQSLTGAKGVMVRHGALFPYDGAAPGACVIPIFHPAHLCRGETRNIQAVVDVLEKVKRISVHGAHPPGHIVTISPYNEGGPEAALEELEYRVAEAIQLGDIAFDFETDKMDPRLATMTVAGFCSLKALVGVAVSALAWDQRRQVYQPCWTPAQWERAWTALAELWSAPIRKWAWNVNFDKIVGMRYWPKHWRGPFSDGIHWDWLNQPDTTHRLGYACQRYLDIGAWKADFWDAQKARETTDENLRDYNARDNLYTAAVIPYVKSAVKRRRNEHLVDHQNRVTRLALKAQLHGVPVDMDLLRKRRAEYEEKRAKCLDDMKAGIDARALTDLNSYVHADRIREARMRAEEDGRPYKEPKRWTITIDDFNPRSMYQGPWYLYEHLKLPITQWTKGGKSEDQRKKRPSHSYKAVLDYLHIPEVKLFTDFSEYDDPISRLTEFETHLDDRDSRVHPSWNTTGQAGTRWTSSPGNYQNLYKKIKQVLRAEPGYVWVGADAAQLEARVLAALAGIKRMLEVFNRPAFDEKAEPWKKLDPAWDSHSLVAAMVYGDVFMNADAEERTKLRTLVKRVVYGMNYGAYPDKIRSALLLNKKLSTELRRRLTKRRVTQIFEGFHSYFPEVNRWAHAEIAKVQAYGFQEFPPLGRRRYWPVKEIEGPKIRNTPIQLGAGDLVNTLFCAMDDEVEERRLDATMAIHGHDACYWHVRETQAEDVKELVNRHFKTWFRAGRHKVQIYGTASIGESPADVA